MNLGLGPSFNKEIFLRVDLLNGITGLSHLKSKEHFKFFEYITYVKVSSINYSFAVTVK